MPPLQPGDADQDLEFDQHDLIKVLQAAKYLTGQAATWGEGDFDGAPGGRPDSPPAGNGPVRSTGHRRRTGANVYVTGTYAALADRAWSAMTRHHWFTIGQRAS